MKKIESYMRMFVITVALILFGSIAIRPAKTQEPVKIQVVEITPGFSAYIAPGQQVIGFACTGDERMLAPMCYALVK